MDFEGLFSHWRLLFHEIEGTLVLLLSAIKLVEHLSNKASELHLFL